VAESKWAPFTRDEERGGTQAERFYSRYWDWLVETGYYRKPPPARLHVALRALSELAPGPDAGGRRLWLDAGCADGKLGRLVAEQGLGFASVGADISETALELAKESYDRVVRWDATAGSLADHVEPGSAAALTCLDVIEHLFDPGQALADFRRVLRPDGLLVISTPNFAHYRARLTVLRGEFPTDDQHIFHEADHLHYFTRASFRELLESAGFEVLRVEGTVMQVPRALAPLDARLHGRIGHRAPTLFARQLVASARPAPGAAATSSS
jgi:2-polyprenyl-3-methyl-5-hydroxy-6-metoxy-1,4-benzoquinol methylase